ncbi:MAG: sigma-70 family RNA polymerase sigma factor [Deltaproteobacteria bacterium]
MPQNKTGDESWVKKKSDEDLIRIYYDYIQKRLSKNEKAAKLALDELVARYTRYVFNRCRLRCQRLNISVEDCTQDVWTRIIAALNEPRLLKKMLDTLETERLKGKDIEYFKLYLNLTIRNLFRELLRKRAIVERVDAGGAGHDNGDSQENEDIFDEVAGIVSEKVHDIKELKIIIEKCIKSIGKTDRGDLTQVIRLYMADNTQREMAKKMNIALGTVNNRLKDACFAMKECLKKNEYAEEDSFECFNVGHIWPDASAERSIYIKTISTRIFWPPKIYNNPAFKWFGLKIKVDREDLFKLIIDNRDHTYYLLKFMKIDRPVLLVRNNVILPEDEISRTYDALLSKIKEKIQSNQIVLERIDVESQLKHLVATSREGILSVRMGIFLIPKNKNEEKRILELGIDPT